MHRGLARFFIVHPLLGGGRWTKDPHSGVSHRRMFATGGERSAIPFVAVVQGASRGLGAEFCRQLLARDESTYVVACSRSPETSPELNLLQATYGAERLVTLPLDLAKEATIETAAETIRNLHGRVDLLINTAGVLHIPGTTMQPETTVAKLDHNNMLLSFQTNCLGPMLVCKHLVPLMARRSSALSDTPRSRVIANLSARVGSIGDNGLGGWYSYRGSKAALNQMSKTLAIELGRKQSGITVLMLHPGTCDTDLTKPFQKNVRPEKLFPRERGVEQLLTIIDRATEEDNGKFYDWKGDVVPW